MTVRTTSFPDVRGGLQELLRTHLADFGRRAGETEEPQLPPVRYALVAFADEVFIHLRWPGQDAWRRQLLEEEVFHTHEAGQRLFEEIKALLASRDTARVETAIVYLLVLSLGFQGRYRGTGESAQLEEWRRRLLSFISSQLDRRLELNGEPLFFQAYEATRSLGEDERELHGPEGRRLASLWPWFALLAAVLVLYTVGGHFLWRAETQRLRNAISYIRGGSAP
ncbi:DotU family type IV/VI secretion system protein [Archangium sp.]|uniref:DotU family type IV/VI secretion system protein n=1 Tax=Archangium sp. TaxID=1872627 RepID=UPI002ED9B13C